MDIQKEIEKLIEDSLPAATAGRLRDYLEQAEGWREEASCLGDLSVELQERIDVLEVFEKESESLKRLKEGLDARETTVSGREKDLDMKVLNIRLAEAEKRAEAIHDLTKTVFSNQELVISRSKDAPFTDQYGNQSTLTVSESETRRPQKNP